MNANVAKLKPEKKPNPNDPKDIAWEAVRTQITHLIDNGVITGRQLSKESSNSESALNQFLRSKYTGRNDLVNDRLQSWLDTYHRRIIAQKEIPDSPGFLFTPSAQKINDTLTYAHMAQDIALIYGGAGVGKTEAFRDYARNNSGVCIATMTPSHSTVGRCLKEIGKCIGLRYMRSNDMLYDVLCDSLRERRGLLIIDEAQHLGIKALDQIRQIHDRIQCGLVFAGNEQVYSNISGGRRAEYLDRLFSRIGMRTRINKPSGSDAAMLIEAWGIDDNEAIKMLVNISKKPGGLRGVTKTVRLAFMLTGKETPKAKHIRAAWNRLSNEQV